MGLGWVAEADLGLAAGALAAAAPVLATVAATAPGQYGRWSQKLDPDGGGFLEHFAGVFLLLTDNYHIMEKKNRQQEEFVVAVKVGRAPSSGGWQKSIRVEE
eukprot:CAMPEP_0194584744 /NCGR_PEP_ID=MMETSP0292-20121207/17249_1 /TAXON_ID=39354 /ORGANISM="Heterosigma akashiwo, Strain CCMP2393" /LENGTH=101 /DNA_ID=CAMNT_0039439879 /DNA_START=557 /DNA_END=863 /DNA_ORIENTATION=-